MPDTIVIASDHAGVKLKSIVKQEVELLGYLCNDIGAFDEHPVDYPVFGKKAALLVAEGKASKGIIICGTGIGISIAANRNPKIRAAVCHDKNTARLARQHNDANILALGARVVDEATAKECVHTFLTTPFEGGRHGPRVTMLSEQ